MDRFNGEDPNGMLRGLDQIYNGNDRKHAIYRAWDKWDAVYGAGKKDYEVYSLCNLAIPGPFVYTKYGFTLTFPYKPFYIGQGQTDRSIDSAAVGRQRDKGGEKIQYLEEMQQKRQSVRIEILGVYHTSQKAKVIESKLLNLIPKSDLTNCEFPWCDIPLSSNDNIIIPDPVLTL